MIITEDNFAYMMMCLEANDEVAVDTETTGFDVRSGRDYLMGFCFSVDGMACYVPFRHKTDNLNMRYLPHIEKVLQTKDLIFHNRKFDMHSIKTIGIDPLSFTGKQYDTLMIAQLINEELYSKELDFLGRKFLQEGKYKGDVIKEIGKRLGFENVPVEMYKDYGPQDADLTRRLKKVLWPQLQAQDLEKVYWETEAPFTNLLYKMEQRGVGVNRDLAEEKAVLGRGRMGTITRELKFNPASPIALGKYLLDELNLPILAHTDSCSECKQGRPLSSHEGNPSFNKRAMEEYDDILSASSNPAAMRIAEYRGWQKAVTSLYEPLLEKTGPDGKIRTEFKQHGTVTGRLSANNPNLQQVPRGSDKPWNGNAKSCFHSGREDYKLVGWDYSQLELRLAAAYGREALLLTEFEKDSADPFSALAPLIFGVLTPETRHDTKTFVYANLYGAGLRKIASQLGRPLDEVEELYQNYHRSIPGVMDVSSQVAKLVEARGWVTYWDGRRRHIRNKSDSYKAWNSVCQGGGAQLVKKAMLRCEAFESDECFMVLQVHDEITFCIREDRIGHYEPLIVDAMTNWGDTFGVKMAVEGKEWK